MNLDRSSGRPPRRGDVNGSAAGADLAWVLEEVLAIRPPFTIDTTATAQNIGRVRRDFAAWLAVDTASGDLLDDVVLAVYEALANVADHAYADTEGGLGEVRLVAHRADESLRVTVSDSGCWRGATGAPFRSHGLSLIHLLIGQVHIDCAASGTTVHLRTPIPAPRT